MATGRPGLATRLGGDKSLHVVVSTSGLSLGKQVEEAQPDVVLLDLRDERAASWLREGKTSSARPAVMVLADAGGAAASAEWLRAGAVRAVLPRHATAAEIVPAIEAVSAGLIVLHPDTMPLGARRRQASAVASVRLTPREIEVLGMMAEGLGNKIIAAHLRISLHTVKFHIASIFTKLNAGSRAEAVTIGIRQGLIMI
jgi:NarL family two-component system response regulator YdfI